VATAGSDALRLWTEVMQRLTITLQAKGIVRGPASDLGLVDALLAASVPSVTWRMR